MKIKTHKPVLKLRRSRQPDYPLLGIVCAMLLIYLSPFTGSLTSYAAFLICLYRVFRYDAKIFATDYCLLVPLAQIFCTSGGMSLFVYLSLLGAVWYFIRSGIRMNSTYVLLIILLNYLLMRMQMNISNFLLCFGQLCVLCIVLPEQDRKSAERAVWFFCIGLVVSSAYGLIFRNAWPIRLILGPEDEAIWGTGIKRFYGLYRDPNYYMTLLIVGLTILAKLNNCKIINAVSFIALSVAMVIFGVLTYSKMFFLTFVLFGIIYIVWRFRDKKYVWGVLLTIAALIAMSILFKVEIGPLGILLERLRGARNLSDLTTGRSDVFALYLTKIMDSLSSFLFGAGLGAEGLYKDAHNVYLEIVYYLGIVGLILMLVYLGCLIRAVRNKMKDYMQSAISKYVALFLVAVLYTSLHGMFQIMFYGEIFVSLLLILVTTRIESDRQE